MKRQAYVDEVPVNWCPALGTVLANEKSLTVRVRRGGHPVERRPMRQWMLKITAYGDRLLEDLDELDWPESLKICNVTGSVVLKVQKYTSTSMVQTKIHSFHNAP